jgi:hypothetical protein
MDNLSSDSRCSSRNSIRLYTEHKSEIFPHCSAAKHHSNLRSSHGRHIGTTDDRGLKIERCQDFQWNDVRTTFHENLLIVSKKY